MHRSQQISPIRGVCEVFGPNIQANGSDSTSCLQNEPDERKSEANRIFLHDRGGQPIMLHLGLHRLPEVTLICCPASNMAVTLSSDGGLVHYAGSHLRYSVVLCWTSQMAAISNHQAIQFPEWHKRAKHNAGVAMKLPYLDTVSITPSELYRIGSQGTRRSPVGVLTASSNWV